MEAAAVPASRAKRVKREPTAKELAKAAKLEELLVRLRAARQRCTAAGRLRTARTKRAVR
jgi:hypothetical protein